MIHPDSGARGQAGVGITLRMRGKRVFLDWIPVNSRLCAVPLDVYVRANNSRLNCRRSFVVSVHAPIDFSSHEAKDEGYRRLL